MARQDIAGLLTGMPTQRPDPSMGREQWAMAFGQQQADRVGQGLRGLTGATTVREQAGIADLKAQERIGKLATSQDPAELRQAAQLLQQRGDPAGAARILAQLQAMEAKKAATAAALVEEKRYQEKFGLEKRKVEAAELKAKAAELKAETAAKAKVYEPKINVDSDGRITVISTDPATAGSIISRASTRSAAAVEAEKEIERQEKLRQSQQLVIKRNTLVGQAADIRFALEEAAEAAKILPLATGFAIQKENPTYATLVGGQTYQKLVDAVSAVQSAQALNSLAELKQQSSTGASGLGATNAMEFSALQSNIRKLNPDVPSTIEAGLQAIERNLDNIVRIDQGLEPIIDWSDPAYAHMVKEKQDGSRAYSYDGKTWYNITEPVGE